jgi:hypothetical protein
LYDVIPNEYETTLVSFKSIPFPGLLTFYGAGKQLNYWSRLLDRIWPGCRRTESGVKCRVYTDLTVVNIIFR